MDQKGEFEQRPEVKPAEQVPLPKAKASPLPWILCVIFALAAAGLGVVVFSLANGNKDNKPNCVTAIDDQNGGEKPGEDCENNNQPQCEETKKNKTTEGRGYMYETAFGTFYVTKSGDTYLEMKKGKLDTGIGSGEFRYVTVNFDKGHEPGVYGKYSVSVDTDGILVEHGSDSYSFEGYKLEFVNPGAIESLSMGNNWLGWNIAFTYPDGHLDWLFIAPDGYVAQNHGSWAKITKDVGGYTDLVAVKQDSDASGYSVLGIFKDGRHELLDKEILFKLEEF